jgi:Flp pilus assembly protein TadG
MFCHHPDVRRGSRRGAVAAELAILLPLLTFLLVVAVDFTRLYYHYITVTNCARNGAYYGCDPLATAQSPYQSIQQAALADASNLSPQPTVTTSQSGNSVEVTVTYPFQTIVGFPGVPNSVNLTSTVRMRVAPRIPRFD